MLFLPRGCLTSVRWLLYFRCFGEFTDSTPPVAGPVVRSNHTIRRGLSCYRIGLHSDKVCQ
jgi:hypothetical protein